MTRGVSSCWGMPMSHWLPTPRLHFQAPEELAMDEEAVQKPAGPPTRKKFLIPMDEGVVPPPGVGRGDAGTAERLGGLG